MKYFFITNIVLVLFFATSVKVNGAYLVSYEVSSLWMIANGFGYLGEVIKDIRKDFGKKLTYEE